MNSGLGRFFYGNWKNKAVALFFAISIWFLAYQSETRSISRTIRVRFQPLNTMSTAIVGVRFSENEKFDLANGAEVPVRVELTGPRKQIDKIEDGEFPVRVISLEREEESYIFQPANFGYPSGGVYISKMSPKTAHILQQDVRERVIGNLADSVTVTGYDSAGKQVIAEILRPRSGELRIRGPEDKIGKVSVNLPVDLGYSARPVQREVTPRVSPASDDVVKHTVEFWDYERESWVPGDSPPKVLVSVRLAESAETFACDTVRVVFQLPVTEAFFKTTLRDVPPGTDTIPVEFKGPKADIERLRQDYQRSGITLSVPVPPSFDKEKGGTYTFTEDSLKLDGYSSVTIGQHARRREERRAFWSYEVKVFVQKEGNDG